MKNLIFVLMLFLIGCYQGRHQEVKHRIKVKIYYQDGTVETIDLRGDGASISNCNRWGSENCFNLMYWRDNEPGSKE